MTRIRTEWRAVFEVPDKPYELSGATSGFPSLEAAKEYAEQVVPEPARIVRFESRTVTIGPWYRK